MRSEFRVSIPVHLPPGMNDQGGPRTLAALCALVREFPTTEVRLSRHEFAVSVAVPSGEPCDLRAFAVRVSECAMRAALAHKE
jgi:hypothetical protein